MPGLTGFTSHTPLSPQDLDAQLQRLKSLMHVPKEHEEYDILFGPQTAGTLICPTWQTTPRTYQNQTGTIGWLDGNLYNRATLCRHHNWAIDNDIEFLVAITTQNIPKSALKNIDGIFTAVILDTHKNQLHLITDRYGLRPIYLLNTTKGLHWSSEPKAFLGLPHFSPQISANTASIFLTTGQLPPNQTWFDNVVPLEPATHLTLNTNTGTLTRERYWWWDQVPPRVGKIEESDLVNEFADLFKNAVTTHTPAQSHGLLLSGGLDSRAIFASLADAPPTFTFGQQESEEVRIASDVAAIKMAPHTILPLTADNWLPKRLEAIWWGDGMLNCMHMHGVEHLNTISSAIEVCFNGAGGDGLAGGGHLFEPHELHTYLAQSLRINLEENPNVKQNLDSAFQKARSAHAFYIDWRMRGFTIHGPRLGLFAGIDYRLPFLDNALQAFLHGLPLSVKQNNKLYHAMLLHAFSPYFHTIPWAKTGKPITWSKWSIRTAKLVQKIQKRAVKLNYTNYPQWLREDPAKTLIDTHLNTPQARFAQYVSPEPFAKRWQAHLSGEDHSDVIGRYLTFEHYLRQVFDKSYRTGAENDALLSAP